MSGSMKPNARALSLHRRAEQRSRRSACMHAHASHVNIGKESVSQSVFYVKKQHVLSHMLVFAQSVGARFRFAWLEWILSGRSPVASSPSLPTFLDGGHKLLPKVPVVGSRKVNARRREEQQREAALFILRVRGKQKAAAHARTPKRKERERKKKQIYQPHRRCVIAFGACCALTSRKRQ